MQKNKEAAVTFMKFYTSPTGQAITNDSGRPPSTKLMQESVQNPLVKEILAHTRIANSVGYEHLQNISPAVNDYIHDIIGEVVSGGSIDEALAKLEKLRLEAIKK
jgi:ABC-type glycerol-3-phosphate transport system substrate-binding protein